jgi:hypothetical protein
MKGKIMSEKEELTGTIAITLGAIGAVAIITAQAIRIVELKSQVQKKDKTVKDYKRRYNQALNLMTVEQLQKTLSIVVEDLKFEEVIKNFK